MLPIPIECPQRLNFTVKNWYNQACEVAYLRGRITVVRIPLEDVILVRIQAPQQRRFEMILDR